MLNTDHQHLYQTVTKDRPFIRMGPQPSNVLRGAYQHECAVLTDNNIATGGFRHVVVIVSQHHSSEGAQVSSIGITGEAFGINGHTRPEHPEAPQFEVRLYRGDKSMVHKVALGFIELKCTGVTPFAMSTTINGWFNHEIKAAQVLLSAFSWSICRGG